MARIIPHPLAVFNGVRDKNNPTFRLPAFLGVELEPYLRSKAKIDIMCADVDFRIGIVVMRRMSFASSGGKRFPPLVFVSIGGV